MKRPLLLLAVSTVLLCFALPAFSQDPPDITAGLYPSATYLGSDFEFVDMTTGKLNLQIPLLADHSQRGDLNFTYSLTPTGWGSWYGGCYYPYSCTWMPGNEYSPLGSVPVMEGALSAFGYDPYGGTIAADSSGAEHLLYPPSMSASYLESVDGSGIQMPSSCTLGSYCVTSRQGVSFVNNYFPNSTSAAFVKDRNGNKMTLSGGNGTYNALFGTDSGMSLPQFSTNNSWTMTDTLGRSWSFSQAGNTSGCPSTVSAASASIWTTPGPAGGTRQFEFCYSNISVSTELQTTTDMTEYQWTGSMSAITAVVLPDGTNWQFQYGDSYGDVTEVILPTGGTVSYSYALESDPCSSAAFVMAVASRTPNDGTSPRTWHYSWDDPIDINSATDPLGNETDYVLARCGEASTIKYYSGSASRGTLLKTVSNTYTDTSLGSTYAACQYDYANASLPASQTTAWPNGQMMQATTTYDAGSNFTWPCYTGATAYALYGFVTTQSQSDYYTSGSPPVLSTTNTSYVALSNPTTSYMSPGNLLDLVSSTKVTDDSSNLCSETDYTYDGSTGSDPSGVSEQHDSAPFSVRGNLTLITRELFTSPCSSSAPTETAVPTTQNVYDTGMLHSTTDPLANITTYVHSSSSPYYGAYTTTVTNAKLQSTTYTYDSNTGEMASMTDPNGAEITYSYDCMLRPTAADNVASGEQETMTYIYGSSTGCGSGNPYSGAEYSKKITSSLNYSNTTTFDGLGRTIHAKPSVDSSTCSGGYAYVDTTYDGDGRVSTVSNPDCTSTTSDDVNTAYSYDSLNRVTQVLEQDGSAASTSYLGNCTTATDETGKARKTCADGAGRMTGVWEDPFGANYETDYGYDPLGDLLQVQQKGGAGSTYWRTRTFSYDSLSRLLCAANPEIYPATCPGSATGAIQYAYDGDNNVISKTAPKENQSTESTTVTTTYSYETLNRLSQKSYNDSTTPTVSYSYDSSSLSCPTGATSANIGQRTAMSDAGGSESWAYCYLSGGVTGVTDQRTTNGITKTTSYTSNYDGTMATLTYPVSNRTITYGVNIAEQPTSAQDTANSISYASSALYTPFGGLSSLTNGSGSTILTSLYYNPRMQPCRIAVNSSGTAPGSCVDSNQGNVMDLTYSLNSGVADNGNVTGIANNIDNTRSQAFTYDALNRLATAATSTYSASAAHCWGELFGYDAWGNFLSIGAISSAYTGCTQEAPSLTVGTNNQITTSGFSYDAAGNLTAESTSGPNFTYNAEGQMTQAASSATAGYVYDGDGRRVGKTASGSAYELYWYDTSGNVLDETDGSGNLLNEYIFFGGKRIARRKVQ